MMNMHQTAAVVAAIVAIPACTFAAPRIACDSPTVDFGVSANTGSVEHAFVIWNKGDSPLEINRIVSCCGATTTVDAKTINPGTNTTVHVRLSLHGRQTNVRKAVYLGSNDPQDSYYRLNLIGVATATVANASSR